MNDNRSYFEKTEYLSQSFLKRFPYNKKVDEDSSYIKLGTSTDLILTEPDEFLKQFVISKSTLKDGPVKDLIDKLPMTGSLESNKDLIYDHLMEKEFKGFGKLNKEGNPRETWWDKVLTGEEYYNDKLTGKSVLTQSDYWNTKKCVELFHHPFLDFIHRQEIEFQTEMFTSFRGEKVKGKTDLILTMLEDIPELELVRGETVICDLKTGSNEVPTNLMGYCTRLNVFFQASWYLTLLSKIRGKKITKFLVVYCNPKYSYPVYKLFTPIELKVGAYGGNYDKKNREVYLTDDKYPDLKGFIPQLELYKEYQLLPDTFTPPHIIKSKGRI